MGKLGGLALLAVVALTGCAAETTATVAAETGRVSSHRATTDQLRVTDAAMALEFIATVRSSGSSYAALPDTSLANMARELCAHYADGFTTEDLRASDGERLALVGEAARATVCLAP